MPGQLPWTGPRRPAPPGQRPQASLQPSDSVTADRRKNTSAWKWVDLGLREIISMEERRNSDKREVSQEFCTSAAFGCSGKNEKIESN